MKAQANETLLNELTSSDLSVDLKNNNSPGNSQAFTLVDGETREIAFDEVEAGVYLTPPELTSEAHERIQKLTKRRFLSKLFSPSFEDASIIAGGSLLLFLLSASIQKGMEMTGSAPWSGFNGLLVTSFFAGLGYSFLAIFWKSRHTPEAKFLSEGILEVPEFRDSSGTAYEVGRPTHKELYGAVLKFGELHGLVRQREKLETSIEKLRMRVKSKRVQEKLDDELAQLSSLDNQVRGLEKDIQTLLRGQQIDESTST